MHQPSAACNAKTTYRQEAPVLGSIVDQAKQVAIILLCLCVGTRHKHQLLTEAAPSREPGLCFPGVSVYPSECLRNDISDGVCTILTGDIQPLLWQLQSPKHDSDHDGLSNVDNVIAAGIAQVTRGPGGLL